MIALITSNDCNITIDYTVNKSAKSDCNYEYMNCKDDDIIDIDNDNDNDNLKIIS